MRPVMIKYRDGNKTVTIKADSCSGEIPAYSNTYFCHFYLGDEPYGNGRRRSKEIARVAESNLLPGYKEVYKKLFGRPWMAKIRAYKTIMLSEYHDWENRLDGLPNDAISVWMVNYDMHTWVIVAGDKEKSRAILHVMNNAEVTKRGEAKEAIKKLFPGKEVRLVVPTTTTVKL